MKSYFQCESCLVPFAQVTVIVTAAKSSIEVFTADGNTESTPLKGEDAARFLTEYTAWLDAQENRRHSFSDDIALIREALFKA